MSKLLSEEIVEAVTLGDKEGFMSAFHSALAAKVSDALELKKVEIASTLVAPASNEVVEEEVEQIDEVISAKERKWREAVIDRHGDTVRFKKKRHEDAKTYHTVAFKGDNDKYVGNFVHSGKMAGGGVMFPARTGAGGKWTEVSEEVKQIDELSGREGGILDRYRDAVQDRWGKTHHPDGSYTLHGNPGRNPREKGYSLATRKLVQKPGYRKGFVAAYGDQSREQLQRKGENPSMPVKVLATRNEEVEQIDEISAGKLHNYYSAAIDSNPTPLLDTNPRRKGVDLAAKKLFQKPDYKKHYADYVASLPAGREPERRSPAKVLATRKEEVELDEAAKPDAKGLKVSFGKTHSGQPGGDGQSDKVITHHDNRVKVTSAIGWDGDHHIDVHHEGKHVGGIFSTHGGVPGYYKNEKYKGGIGHKEVKAAMNAHQKHPEVQSWLIHNHPDSAMEADSGTINGHKLHPTAEKYLEKYNSDDHDYEAPYKPQTSSAVKPKQASTSSAYEKALAALKKKHGINEEAEEIEEAKGETRISWRARTPEEIAKSDKRRKVKVTSAELEARARARRAEKSE